jgi:hypothetical protein
MDGAKLPPVPIPPTAADEKEFLEKDLYDALRWSFVSAVTWHATKGRERALAMNTNFAQSRALYEFYFAKVSEPDDARAFQFVPSWAEPESTLYLKYMKRGKPANKRVFHLVYDRSIAANAGGVGHDGPDHIKNQVLEFAKDLRRITEQFIGCVKPQFQAIVRTTLDNALSEAKKTADCHGIPNPL